MIEKWGGLVIIMAALFPLPFAMISTIAGIVKYPFKTYLLYGLTRYIRFYLYAIVIFGALKEFI
jgi:membrane protein DedA with SNARE-associated domain